MNPTLPERDRSEGDPGYKSDKNVSNRPIRSEWTVVDSPPKALTTLVERFDIAALDRPPEEARVRLKVPELGAWDVVIRGRRRPVLEPRSKGRADATLIA